MLENIRRIGLFMIVAQTVIHFAAGKQYEKYMKIITGIMILLMFTGPLVSSGEDMVSGWQGELEKMTGQMAEYMEDGSDWQQGMSSYADYGVRRQAVRQLEEEIKARLNQKMTEESYKISDVMIEWEENAAEEGDSMWKREIRGIRITLRQSPQREESRMDENVQDSVRIDEIRIETGIGQTQPKGDGAEAEKDAEEVLLQYRTFFSEILGMEEDKVEVNCIA